MKVKDCQHLGISSKDAEDEIGKGKTENATQHRVAFMHPIQRSRHSGIGWNLEHGGTFNLGKQD